MRYRFQGKELDTEARTLKAECGEWPLSPKLLGLLELLVSRAGRTVTKAEILERVWPETFVSEGAVHRTVARLRRLLGTGRGDLECIVSVSGVGYRFVAEVERAGGKTRRRAGPERFVGRDAEMDACRGLYRQLEAGRGGVLCLTGEAGIGKTTLMEAFRAWLPANVRTGVARCPEPLRTDMGYLPVMEILEDLCAGTDGGRTRRVLEERAPNWEAQVFGNPEGGLDRVGAERAKREVRTFLAALVEEGPVVLFFDDFHWSDHSTLDLIAYLTTRVDEIPLGLVVLYRPAELKLRTHPFASVKLDLELRGRAREVPLAFLDEASVGAYLAAACPGHGFPRELASELYRRTEGSPLFVSGLVDDLKRTGKIRDENGRWELQGDASEIPQGWPPTVRAMVERKLGQLDPGQRELLSAAALRGYEFESAVLASALGWGPAAMEGELGRLEATYRLIARCGNGSEGAGVDYRFVHALYQEALLEGLEPARRRELAGALAQALVAGYGERNETVAARVARLFAEAGDPWRASGAFLLAARVAKGRGAYEEAGRLAETGAAGIARLGESPEVLERRLQLLVVLASVQQSMWLGSEVPSQIYARAGEIARQLGGEEYLIQCLFGQWVFLVARMQTRAALTVAREIEALGAGLPRPPLEALIPSGSVLLRLGRLREARAALERIPEESHRLGLDGSVGILGAMRLTEIGACLELLGYPDRASAAMRQVNSAHGRDNAYLYVVGWYMQYRRRDFEAALATARRYLGGEGVPNWQALITILLGAAQFETGDASGLETALDGLRRADAMGSRAGRGDHVSAIAEMMARVGRFEEGLDMVQETLEETAAGGEQYGDARLWKARGNLYLAAGRQDCAEDAFLEACRVARGQDAKTPELEASLELAHLYIRSGRPSEAFDAVRPVYSWFTEGFDTGLLRTAARTLEELQPGWSSRGKD